MPENEKISAYMKKVKEKHPNEPEFHQAVMEWLSSVIPYLEKNPEMHKKYDALKIMDRLLEPDRILMFRVSWLDDRGVPQTNIGYRIQWSNAIGPYKGGLRFHPSVNLGILKFLAFEQVFKNALTTLPMGGAKGGSDFDPKGKSDNEVMRFCQSFMNEIYRHIGQFTDVPAGDIGVGGREIGFLFGQHKKLTREYTGVLTGKGEGWGGSLIRPEATGYGLLYFVAEMLKTRGDSMKGKVVAISGSGNVAQYAAEKAIQMGAKVVTMSDSDGMIHDPDGIDAERLAFVMNLKNVERGRIKDYIKKYKNAKYFDGKRPWSVKCDIALPCATQNEIDGGDAKVLIKNGCKCVAEGANMPSTLDAVKEFLGSKILYSPGKAANAGGVATSGLEMSQNSLRLYWTREEVDQKLHGIMKAVHEQCARHGKQKDGFINYVDGANISAFIKVAEAMVAQGTV